MEVGVGDVPSVSLVRVRQTQRRDRFRKIPRDDGTPVSGLRKGTGGFGTDRPGSGGEVPTESEWGGVGTSS